MTKNTIDKKPILKVNKSGEAIEKLVQAIGSPIIVKLFEKKFTDSPIISVVKKRILEIIEEENQNRIIVDLSLVENISEVFISMLTYTHQKTRSHHGKLVICGLNQKLIASLAARHLVSFFNIAEDIPSALIEMSKP